MLKNITKRCYVQRIEYELVFMYDGDSGYGFPCDEHGNVTTTLSPDALTNLEYCKSHPELFEVYNKVVANEYTDVTPSHGTCSCGNEVTLIDSYYGACSCEKCGRWYNMFGQELLPPEHWDVDPSEEEYY